MLNKVYRALFFLLLLVLFLFGGSERVLAVESSNEVTETEACYTSVEEAGVAVRKLIKNHEEEITVVLQRENGDSQLMFDIMEVAFAHTGVPDEGDYLRSCVSSQNVTDITYITASDNTNCTQYTVSITYRTTLQQERHVDAVVAELVKTFRRDNPQATIADICEYIANNVVYDDYYFDMGDSGYSDIAQNYPANVMKQTAYGALVNGVAVCEGFSALMYRLALECGVDGRMLSGTSAGMLHAWNILDVTGNGNYYFFDPTNDLGFLGHEFEEEVYRNGLYIRFANFRTDEFESKYPVPEDDYKADITYRFDETTGTLYIDGTGELEDITPYGMGHGTGTLEEWMKTDPYYTSSCPWTRDFRNSVVSIVVGDGITRIGDNLFVGFSNVTGISLPEGLTSIGDKAFAIRSLKSIVIPDTVTSIGDYTFYWSDLESIELPAQLTHLGDGAFSHCGVLQSVVLPDGITRIGDELFAFCGSLQSIQLSDGVTYIGACAFQRCTSLTDINLPDSLAHIGNNAFDYCHGLKALEIPDGVQYIGEAAFIDCISLQSINIPSGVTDLGNQIFYNCNKLECVSLPDTLLTIGSEAFWNCETLSVIDVPTGVISIGDEAFAYCRRIDSILLPATLTKLGENVFCNCSSIKAFTVAPDCRVLCAVDGVLFNEECTELICYPAGRDIAPYTVPDGVRIISDSAFLGTHISEITLPKSLYLIEDKAFYSCYFLDYIEIPEGVEGIGNEAFAGCYGVKFTSLPKSLRQIGSNAFQDTWTSSVMLADGNTAFRLVNGVLYNYDMTEILLFPNHEDLEEFEIPSTVKIIRAGTFSHMSWLRKVIIPDSVTIIETQAFFACQELKEVKLGRGLRVIPYRAFDNYNGLEKIIIPTTITTIDTDAFSHEIGSIYYAGTEEQWAAIAGSDGPKLISAELYFENLYDGQGPSLPDENGNVTIRFDSGEGTVDTTEKTVTYLGLYGDLPVPSRDGYVFCYWSTDPVGNTVISPESDVINDFDHTLYAIWDNKIIAAGIAGRNAAWRLNAEGILTIFGSDGVKYYGEDVTYYPWYPYQSSVVSVEIKKGITDIEAHAFKGYENLTSLSLPDGFCSIKEEVFADCTNLKEVYFPQSLLNVGERAFSNCKNLKTVTFSGGICHVNKYAFWMCNSLTDITLNGVYELSDSAFANCQSLTKVVLPSTLKLMGQDAFVNCTSLEEAVFENGVLEIGFNTFRGCVNLKTVSIGDTVVECPRNIFADCTTLTSVKLSNSMKNIAEYCFANNGSLTEVVIPESVFSIGAYAFSDCISLKRITLPYNLSSIADCAFKNCSSLGIVQINSPQVAAHVSSGSAYGNLCNYASTILIPTSLENINSYITDNFINIETIHLNGQDYVSYSNHIHNWNAEVPDIQFVCSICELEKEIEVHMHDMEEWFVFESATCIKAGEERQNCSGCEYYESRELPAKGHQYEAVVTAPSCTEKGYTTHTCVDCGDSYTDSEMAAVGHVLGSWNITQSATCNADGSERRDCTQCNHYETRAIAATGHTEETVAGYDATCTETGLTDGKKCTDCGTTTVAQNTIEAKGHTEETVAGYDATCTGNGLTEGKKCSVCDTTTVAQKTIEAKGHTEVTVNGTPATCKEAGMTDGKKCSDCGTVTVKQKVIAAKGHTYTDGQDPDCNGCGLIRSVPMYRMYDPNSGEHFYSGSTEERDILIEAGWNYEGVGFNFPVEGEPVFRLYDPVYGEHLYTMDVAEKDKLLKKGWNYEGVAFNSAPNTEVVQYRLHNPNAKRGAYHFTSSEEERALLISFGWEDQGIGWYSCWE